MTASVQVTTPSDLEIVVAREFKASARDLFDFYTKPELVKQWLIGPPGWTMPVCEIDLRVGGKVRYRWRKDDGSHEFGSEGEFREVDAPHRLVQTESMEGMPAALCTLTFVEANGRTTLTTTIRYQSREARDAALETGMADGMGMSYDRLDPLLPAA